MKTKKYYTKMTERQQQMRHQAQYVQEIVKSMKLELRETFHDTTQALEDMSNYVIELTEPPDFPELNYRRDIAEELSRTELIDRLCDMHKNYMEMREEWFKATHLL